MTQRRVLLPVLVALVLISAACTRPGQPATTGSSSGPVTAGGFPNKALRIMAPANPGGGWDQTSRALEEVLEGEQIAAQPVEVFNRGGAGGTVG
jgi:putative tricarboxylic transport membrane protein